MPWKTARKMQQDRPLREPSGLEEPGQKGIIWGPEEGKEQIGA
jgi:hypothetical protein